MNLSIHRAARPGPEVSTWKRDTTTWHDLVASLSTPHRGPKDTATGVFYGTLNGTRKTKDAVRSRTVITLDVDHTTPEKRDALVDHLRATGWAFAVHSTASSTNESPSLRAYLLPSQGMKPATYSAVVQALLGFLMRETGVRFDASCDQPERFMYPPTMPVDGSEYFQVAREDGDAVNVGAWLMLAPSEPLASAEAPEREPSGPARLFPAEQVDAEVAWVVRQMGTLHDLAEGDRIEWPGYGEVGWDVGYLFCANRLIQASNSNPDHFPMDKAEATFMEHAPASWSGRRHKWEQAVEHIGGAGMPGEPRSTPEEDFGPPEAGEEGNAEDGTSDIGTLFPATDLKALLSADRPPRQWVVHSLIPAGASVSLVAAAGVGKSLMSLALALAVARGQGNFAGMTIPRARKVLYVDLENTPDDVAERLLSLGLTEHDDLSHLTYLSLPVFAGGFDTSKGAKELLAVIDHYGIGEGDLVVLDSLQRSIEGPENDSDTLRSLYLRTSMPLKKRRVTVLRLDNTGKDQAKGSRGTSGKKDDVDVELIMLPDKNDPTGTFEIRPNKARIPDVRAFTISRFEDDHGVLTYSTGLDPFRSQVEACIAAITALGVKASASQNTVEEKVREAHERRWSREVVRTACKEWKSLPT